MADISIGAPGATPSLSYVICATPRTGSYVLCEALRATSVAGCPTEYFSGTYERYWKPRWGVETYPEYLARVTRIGTTVNGVFGVKVHPIQFTHFARRVSGRAEVPMEQRRQLVERWFPGARYVWIKRTDKLRQGISYARALQTRMWWDADQPPAPYDAPRPDALRFDQALIERSVLQMHTEEDTWRQYFEIHGLEPLIVNYEEMVDDLLAAVRQVLAHLDMKLPDDFSLPPSGFRRQADATTEEWVGRLKHAISRNPALLLAERAAAPTTAASSPAPVRFASDARTDNSPSEGAPVRPPLELRRLLASRRWWRCTRPYPHVRAENVFVPDLYRSLEAGFRAFVAADRFSRDLPGYDASALAITPANAGPFSVFISREWHDMLAELFGVPATGEVNVTLHHHAKGSLSGSPHNDLNPAWFPKPSRAGDITVHDPARCNYRYGTGAGAVETVERVRAVALIYYLAEPDGYAGWGGETGLYRSSSSPVGRPVVAVPAVNNSLVSFECTPFSFHSFVTNPYAERNCLVMWLHRSRNDVIDRWGEQSIVSW